MYEIGETLREARMRARIDISEVEEKTKIRAKYLRALENEEWGLLPGPAYVKSFLRTYAEYLGLDTTLLLDEYKLRYEQPGEAEAQPITALRGRSDHKRSGPRIPRGAVVAGVLAGIAVVLYVLGSTAENSNNNQPPGTATPSIHTQTKPHKPTRPHRPVAKTVRLRIVPTGPVWVCLVNDAGKRLISGEVIDRSTQLTTYKSKRFKLTLGNGQAELSVNRKTKGVPDRSEAIGYVITPSGRKELPAAERPTCGA